MSLTDAGVVARAWARSEPNGPRCVVHMDLDCFYASVEELEDPALRGKPVAVVMGLDASGHGVVATASYAARAFGVRSATALSAALRLCPELIALPVRHGLYRRYSDRVMGILRDLSPVMQQVSIDEAFVDMTGIADAVEQAREARDHISREIGLPASFGIASGKLTAKIATSQGKPRGFVVVPNGTEAAFLAPLGVEKLWGVGPRTAERLRESGLATLGELAAFDPADLAATFGPRRALELCRSAQGIDDSPLDTDQRLKSISAEQTLGGESDPRRLWALYREMAADLSHRLHERGLAARTVGIKLRLADWKQITRAQTLAQPVDDAGRIAAVAADLMRGCWQRGTPLRLLGIRVSSLASAPDAAQLPLFPDGIRLPGQVEAGPSA